MPWQEVSVMEQRREFVLMAQQEGANRRALCRRFGISAPTAYKWLARAASGGELADRSRRPLHSPGRTEAALETQVLAVRDAHPAWGARKIAHCLARDGIAPPSASTVHAILRRHGRVLPPARAEAGQRFEKPAPNQLWQMDFKGPFALADGRRCHALTMIDDHSRFLLCLAACADQQSATVRRELEATFRRYGLPDAMFVDNGAPWGTSASAGDAAAARWTGLAVWLLKLGVAVLHSRPYHPQSRGKNERLHRSLQAEVLDLRRLRDLAAARRAFDDWRAVYNPASEDPSGYVLEGNRLGWPRSDPARYLGFWRARSVMASAAGDARSPRLKIQGPSGNGWMALISPLSAARRSVFGETFKSRAASPRLSHGSFPSSAALNTGIR